jgi:hypothetical protein
MEGRCASTGTPVLSTADSSGGVRPAVKSGTRSTLTTRTRIDLTTSARGAEYEGAATRLAGTTLATGDTRGPGTRMLTSMMTITKRDTRDMITIEFLCVYVA